MKKRTTLIILLLAFFAFSKNDRAKELYESSKSLSNDQLIENLEIASKSYKGGNDINVLVPIQELMTRKGNAVDLLGQALANKEQYGPEVRELIAEALGEIKDRRAIAYLENSLGQSELKVTNKIIRSLSSYVGKDKFLELIENALTYEEKIAAFKYLTKASIENNYAVFNTLMKIAFNKNENWQIRSSSISLLGRKFDIKSSEFEERLLALINDNTELDFLHAGAISALGKFKNDKYTNIIANKIKESNSPYVWYNCAIALSYINSNNSDDSISALKTIVTNDSYVNKKQKEVDDYLQNGKNDLMKLGISKNNKSENNRS
ncbi:MAG: hypothetical protein GQ534_06800, partial [Candidatus Delongbacteria bacterium]|nr:hypothetical protein [Candidatus Delongbacteria bacterium]